MRAEARGASSLAADVQSARGLPIEKVNSLFTLSTLSTMKRPMDRETRFEAGSLWPRLFEHRTEPDCPAAGVDERPSSKARENGETYALKTATNAARAIEGPGQRVQSTPAP